MANTYTQIFIQFVFAVENRTSLINPTWEVELFKYITGIVTNHKNKMLAIDGTSDHLHILIGVDNTQSTAEIMRIVKGESSEWINKRRLTKGQFRWQSGYGAFSYGKSQVAQVYNYIKNQKEHHKKLSFQSEYVELLKKFGVEYEEKYLFHPIE